MLVKIKNDKVFTDLMGCPYPEMLVKVACQVNKLMRACDTTPVITSAYRRGDWVYMDIVGDLIIGPLI